MDAHLQRNKRPHRQARMIVRGWIHKPLTALPTLGALGLPWVRTYLTTRLADAASHMDSFNNRRVVI